VRKWADLNQNRRIVLALAIVAIASAGAVTTLYVASLGHTQTVKALPPGCTKPAGGFLIVASNLGYNESITHGAPENPWPVVQVKQGQTVNITVCNTDIQSHGFQIAHYYDASEETVEPGGILKLSFVASQTGTFQIYCSIFCSIHVYMQSGQLIVSS
jgi:heme/copper-type cytochrome/quinol oxidase subunit 2